MRRGSQLVTGALWAGTGAAAVGTLIAVPQIALLWKGILFGGAGLSVAAERAGTALMKRKIARMARGEIELADVDARGEGELVAVRGTIEATETLPGVLLETEGVYRRMIFKSRGTWVHEAAVDFALLDDEGNRILIEAAGARWIVPSKETLLYPGTRFAGADVPPRVRELTAGKESVEAFERVLPPGTRVQIVGYKTASTDVTGKFSDYRLPPQRATLRSGPDLPLVISTLEDLR